MIYHDPSKGPPPIKIRIDAFFDAAAPALVRLGEQLQRLIDGLDPRRRVLIELVPLVRAAAALDGGYRSLPRRIPLPPRPADGFVLPPLAADPIAQILRFMEGRERFGGFYNSLYVQQAEPLPSSITCPVCGRTSHNPNDVRQRYCGACRQFHDRMDLRWLP